MRLNLRAPESNSEFAKRLTVAAATVLSVGQLGILAFKPRGIEEAVRDNDTASISTVHENGDDNPDKGCRIGQITVQSVDGSEGVNGGTVYGIAATKTPAGPEYASGGAEVIAELNSLEDPSKVVPGQVLVAPVGDC